MTCERTLIFAPVTERGSTLSAGQRQLLSFARTLAYDPTILVLDEATANIDTETEALITSALAKLMEGRTTIMVAHRLSTIQHADKIIVMHQGQIKEAGTHQELLAQTEHAEDLPCGIKTGILRDQNRGCETEA